MVAGLAVVVATRNRPELTAELARLLFDQEPTPAVVVIVDAGEPGKEVVLDPSLAVIIRSSIASLPHQRNLGIAWVLENTECEKVCFLDDDVRPSPQYLLRLLDLLERDVTGSVGGVSGTTGWVPAPSKGAYGLLQRVFRIVGKADGRVLPSGFNMPVRADEVGVFPASWLFGCSMWRRAVLEQFRFHDSLPGQALFEDVEFSVRVASKFGLLVDTSAYLDHLLAQDERPNQRKHYERIVRNRAEVVKSMGGGFARWFWFWWATLGLVLTVLRHVHSSRDYRDRLVGLCLGISTTLRRSPAG